MYPVVYNLWQLIKCHHPAGAHFIVSIKAAVMFWKWIILILVLASTASGQSATNPVAQLDTLRAEGYAALYNLDYEGARRRFQKMVDLAPEHPAGAQSMAASLWVEQLNESW